MGGYTLQENPLISLIPELNLLAFFSLVHLFGKLAGYSELHAKAVIPEIVPVTHSVLPSSRAFPYLSGSNARSFSVLKLCCYSCDLTILIHVFLILQIHYRMLEIFFKEICLIKQLHRMFSFLNCPSNVELVTSTIHTF